MFSEVTPFLRGKIEAEAGIGSNPYEPGCGAYLDYEAGRRSGEVAIRLESAERFGDFGFLMRRADREISA